MDVSGKSVFLTGGARGIGRGIMEGLLSRRAKVMFCDIRVETGKATEAELQASFGAENVIFQQCDISDLPSFQAAFQAAISKFGAVDIFINNAAIVDERLLEKMVQVNVIGTIRGCQMAMEHMRRDKGGKGGLIINVNSISGIETQRFLPSYCATKHALIGYTTSWAKNPRLAEMGLTWRCFCPDGTNTEFIPTEPDAVVDFAEYATDNCPDLMEVSEVKQVFLDMLDQDSDDVIFLVKKYGKSRFVRRQLVDSDGVSNPYTVDSPQQLAK